MFASHGSFNNFKYILLNNCITKKNFCMHLLMSHYIVRSSFIYITDICNLIKALDPKKNMFPAVIEVCYIKYT